MIKVISTKFNTKGEKLTTDEYNSLSITDKFAYDTKQENNLLSVRPYFNTDIQGQLAKYREQYVKTHEQSQQTQQKQINKQQNVAVSDNTSMYNIPVSSQISVNTYPNTNKIPTVNQIL